MALRCDAARLLPTGRHDRRLGHDVQRRHARNDAQELTDICLAHLA